jgi:hypothetical protein
MSKITFGDFRWKKLVKNECALHNGHVSLPKSVKRGALTKNVQEKCLDIFVQTQK